VAIGIGDHIGKAATRKAVATTACKEKERNRDTPGKGKGSMRDEERQSQTQIASSTVN
jgi:hypothetical protein